MFSIENIGKYSKKRKKNQGNKNENKWWNNGKLGVTVEPVSETHNQYAEDLKKSLLK